MALGRLGGSVKSIRKTSSSRANGKRGGRPPSKSVTHWAPFFDAVDEVRRSGKFESLGRLANSRLPRQRALAVATARALARELKVDFPPWASKPVVLKEPYFVAGVENLKATALIESPVSFRESLIFVLGNFLNRA